MNNINENNNDVINYINNYINNNNIQNVNQLCINHFMAISNRVNAPIADISNELENNNAQLTYEECIKFITNIQNIDLRILRIILNDFHTHYYDHLNENNNEINNFQTVVILRETFERHGYDNQGNRVN